MLPLTRRSLPVARLCAIFGFMPTRRALVVLLLPLFAQAEAASSRDHELAATLYAARISSEPGWEDVFINPVGADYIDSYLAAAGVCRTYARYLDGGLHLEAGGQAAYYFGDQHYWELDAVPVQLRWRRFPWNNRVATSAAFGIGLSYTTELPEIEVQLEGESSRLLIYWVAEVTAGLPGRSWALSLRLHHRSVAYGLMGDEGGMNALGLGLRWRF